MLEHCGPNYDDHLNYRNRNEIKYWHRNCQINKYTKKFIKEKIITEKELSIMYNNEYIIDEKKFLFQRLNEQVLAGNLIKKDNYELTLKGKLFVAIYSFFDLVY